MKTRHTKAFYYKWLQRNNKTKSDLISAIHGNYGVALEQHNIIDYLIYNQFTVHQLKSIFEVL